MSDREHIEIHFLQLVNQLVHDTKNKASKAYTVNT